MKYFVIFFSIVMAFSSCVTKKEGVKLTVLNNELYYTKSSKPDGTKQKSTTNLIKYKISNHTNKKLLFFARDLNLSNIVGIKTFIKSGDKRISGHNKSISFHISDSCYFHTLNTMTDVLLDKNLKLKTLGYSVTEYIEKYHSQTFIINPHESWTFEALLTLPVIVEGNMYLDILPYEVDLDPSRVNKLLLEYEVPSLTIKCLSKNELEELRKNGVEVYLGKLISNEVLLKPVDSGSN
ncbi:hypothetical protein GCM10007424_07700 [Flavobacterium suaedae]|uniref:Lipoprotein n=1 Tax=Flavobacterium suaedae TaxID=1767027 RepID=A0ABQ1JNG2_9FLAO|nr:hypothetical protein [Flavobacterium suaedae]GGB70217.1 hypothetical protein GCM10007424_07700 [Flavobacterium suaedae]